VKAAAQIVDEEYPHATNPICYKDTTNFTVVQVAFIPIQTGAHSITQYLSLFFFI
jgi:hypothetical protein